MPTTKLLFTDIDGVLNSMSTLPPNHQPTQLAKLCPNCIAALNYITDRTNASLIITSSWRGIFYCGAMTIHGFEYMLQTHGIRGRLKGFTCEEPDFTEPRWQQIKDWLRRSELKNYRYVVIDDDATAGIGHPFTKVNGSSGLTFNDAAKAIELLNGVSCDAK